VENQDDNRRKIYRWIFLGVLVLSLLASLAYPPLRPHIQLPAENLSPSPLFTIPGVGGFYLTNTLLATLIADLLLILLAFNMRRAIRSGKKVLTGITGAVSALLELLYDLTESTAGEWARRIFPYFATIFLLVLVVNWMELIPGVDSVGLFDSHHIEHPEECQFVAVLPGVEALVNGESECTSGVVPFVRVASTDLNFTIALALVSVVMTQVIGWQSLGASYFTKYVDTKPLRDAFRKPRFGDPLGFMMGLIAFAVGFLEIIAEIAKIISFSFRLFGNIFAGSVLLFVIGSLVPVFAQSIFLLLEVFVGLIQAVVFGMLTMVFMTQATQGHGDHAEAH
jgi:F-type H+-transporting ATPase subunit a